MQSHSNCQKIKINLNIETRPFFHVALKNETYINVYNLQQHKKRSEFLIKNDYISNQFNYISLYSILRLIAILTYKKIK